MSYTRTRSRTLSAYQLTQTQTTKDGGAPTVQTFNYSDADSITDVVTPKFHQRIQEGAIINNPCTYSRSYVLSDGGGSYKATYVSTGWWFAHNGAVTRARMLDYPSIMSSLTSDLTDAEKSRALSDAKQNAIANIASSPWSFGEDIAEVRETLRYLRNPAASLAEVSKSFERKARSLYYRYGNRAKALSGAWASYRFAMLPLQRSLEDIVESSFVRNQKEFSAGSRLSARGSTHLYNRKNSDYISSDTYKKFTRSRTDDITYKANILYETLSDLKGWQYRYGLRLRDFPRTAWELVPYSFMVDRVANISKCIGGLTNLSDPSIRILAASVVTKTSLEKTCKFVSDTTPQWSCAVSGEVVREGSFTYDRQIWYPSVSDTLPTVNFAGIVKDATSVLDLLSLVTLRLKLGRS